MDKIVIIGSGGHSKSCIDIILDQGHYEILGLVDYMNDNKIMDFPIIGNDTDLKIIFNTCKNAAIGIGQLDNGHKRIEMFNKLKNLGFNIPKIISNSATVSSYSKIGEGTFVMHGSIVGPDSNIGNNCIINSSAIIEHDVKIAKNTHISTGVIINGGVEIGENSFVGSGSILRNGIKIGNNCFIRMGSNVEKNIHDNEKF